MGHSDIWHGKEKQWNTNRERFSKTQRDDSTKPMAHADNPRNAARMWQTHVRNRPRYDHGILFHASSQKKSTITRHHPTIRGNTYIKKCPWG